MHCTGLVSNILPNEKKRIAHESKTFERVGKERFTFP